MAIRIHEENMSFIVSTLLTWNILIICCLSVFIYNILYWFRLPASGEEKTRISDASRGCGEEEEDIIVEIS